MKVIEHHEDDISKLKLEDSSSESGVVFIYDRKQKQLNIIARQSFEECEVTLNAEQVDKVMEFCSKAFKE